jgi:hypothetical protein
LEAGTHRRHSTGMASRGHGPLLQDSAVAGR